MNTRFFRGYWRSGIGWFRIFGYGAVIKDSRSNPPLFSERNGYQKWFYITRHWKFRFLSGDRL